jgi:hypothetical protein
MLKTFLSPQEELRAHAPIEHPRTPLESDSVLQFHSCFQGARPIGPQ